MTSALAIWGAVLSTLAIIWNIRRDLADRGKLRVLCYRGVLRGGVGPPDPKTYLVYHVTNAGRRPVVVTHIGGATTKSTHFMVTTRSPLPRTLQPGEYFLEYTDVSILKEQPQALWAIDSLNKYWKIRAKALKRLLKETRDATDGSAG